MVVATRIFKALSGERTTDEEPPPEFQYQKRPQLFAGTRVLVSAGVSQLVDSSRSQRAAGATHFERSELVEYPFPFLLKPCTRASAKACLPGDDSVQRKITFGEVSQNSF